MFKVLLIKEIQSAIVDFRFWVITLLCVSVIPLSFYVSVKNYSQRLSDYLQEVQIYRDSKVIQYDMTAEGIHPPSPLSIFSQGLGEKMPYKVLTSRNGQYTIETARPDNKNDLMGKMDFAYIVVMVLSILAIVFTFNAISGDKESGIFRMVFSNPVLRRQVLAAKLIGNYLVFLIPFLLSLLIALLMVYFSGMVPIFSPQFFPAVLIMLGISMLFLFALFNLGLWVSSSAKSSALSINVLLLIWIVIGLVIPKISPIISGVIYPVESTGVFEGKKAGLIDNITKERRAEEGKLYEEIRAQLHPGTSGIGFGDIVNSEINSEYDRKVLPIREKYESRLA
ncbi:MAG: ABC transporter permease, partial [Culturomica sp.]|nr:ABC transporter permease [Culturomica sp.]